MKTVFWYGRQWRVTSYGIECHTRFCPIAWGDLHRYRPSYWFFHLIEKDWVDEDDLRQAFREMWKIVRAIGEFPTKPLTPRQVRRAGEALGIAA